MYRRIPALAVAALVFALFACTASSPSPPPASLPPLPYTCPPTPGSQFTTPYPCTSAEHSVNSKRLERDALEAEALAVYQRFVTEYLRLVVAGGSDTLTPELEATLADPLKSEVLIILSERKQYGRTWRGPAPRPSASATHDPPVIGGVITLRTCEDYRGIEIFNPDGTKYYDAKVVTGRRYLKYVDGALKLFHSDAEEMAECL